MGLRNPRIHGPFCSHLLCRPQIGSNKKKRGEEGFQLEAESTDGEESGAEETEEDSYLESPEGPSFCGQTDQSPGFGFLRMSTVEEAERAVEMFNHYDVSGRFLTVNMAAPKGSQPERPPRVFEPSFRIYVGNLPWQVDNDLLEQLFSGHGKVVDARVVYDRESGCSRGFGFVTMVGEAELSDAIAALDGQSLDGRAILVNAAGERPRHSLF